MSTIEITIHLPSGFDFVVKIEVDGCIDFFSNVDVNVDVDDHSFMITLTLPTGETTSFSGEYTLSSDATKVSAMLTWGGNNLRGCIWADSKGAAFGVTFNEVIFECNARVIIGIRFSTVAAIIRAAKNTIQNAAGGVGPAYVNPYQIGHSNIGTSTVETVAGSWFPWIEQQK